MGSFNTYPPRYESAFVVKRLIELGAIIVGKDKTSQFAKYALSLTLKLQPFSDRCSVQWRKVRPAGCEQRLLRTFLTPSA